MVGVGSGAAGGFFFGLLVVAGGFGAVGLLASRARFCASFSAAFFASRAVFSSSMRAATASSSRCASHSASRNHELPRWCPWSRSNASRSAVHRAHSFGV